MKRILLPLALAMILSLAWPFLPLTPTVMATDANSLLTTTHEQWPTYNVTKSAQTVMVSDGTYWSVYTNHNGVTGSGVFAIHYALDGTVTDNETIADPAGNQLYPSIAIDSSDTLHVVYVDLTGTDTTRYKQRPILTGTWSAAIALTTTDSNDGPSIAVDSNDYIHVCYDYSEPVTLDHCIGYRVSTDGGATFAANERVSPAFTAGWEFDYYPVIAIGANDHVHVAWQGYGRGAVNFDSYQIHYQERIAGTGWTNYYEVTEDAGGDMFEPSIAVDTSGTIHIAWNDDSGVHTLWYAAYRSCSSTGVWGAFTDPGMAAGHNQWAYGISLTTNGGVYILTACSNFNVDLLTKPTAGVWLTTDNITSTPGGVDADLLPSSSWAMWPQIGTQRSNYPSNGLLYLYSRDFGVPGSVRFGALDYDFAGPSQPLTDFMATPISCSRVDLFWNDPNTDNDTVQVIVRGKAGSYPNTPPTTLDGSHAVYTQDVGTGATTVSDVNLTAGTTYYYRIWRYDTVLTTYTLDGEDFATTYACVTPPGSTTPDWWYQEPTCDMYYETILWPAMNYAVLAYQFPANYFCMLTTFFLISVCSVASFPLALAGSAGSPKSMVVPFIIAVALIAVTASAGAIPFGISIVSIITLGGVAVFIWNRV